jgi:cell division septum initiation protein DivIVA
MKKMKKVKSIKQLKEEKKRLAEKRERLENEIKKNWNSLKESLQPGALAANAIDKMRENTMQENSSRDSVLKSTFTYGLSLLAQKFADKTEEKLKKAFRNKRK